MGSIRAGRIATAEGLRALAASTSSRTDPRLWNLAVDGFAGALMGRARRHERATLFAAWRARLLADEEIDWRLEHQRQFWPQVLRAWDAYSYETAADLIDFLFWQGQLRGSSNVELFREGLALWPIQSNAEVVAACADDRSLIDFLSDGGLLSPGFPEGRRSLLLRQTHLLRDWVNLRTRFTPTELARLVEHACYDVCAGLSDDSVPLRARLEAIDSLCSVLAFLDAEQSPAMATAVDMFWDWLLPKTSDGVPATVLKRLREWLLWHSSIAESLPHRRSVEHALDDWPNGKEAGQLRNLLHVNK